MTIPSGPYIPERHTPSDPVIRTSDMQAALSGKLASSVTKAELNTAVSDGNVVYVGDGLNGALGADTPSTVAATTVSISGLTVGRIPYVGTSNILSNSTSGPYWDNTNNEMRVGPGSATYGSFGNGTGVLHARQDSGVAAKIRVSTAGNQSWLALDRCNGSVASQTALASADVIGSVVGVGCYGSSSAYVHGPQIDLLATQAWTVSANGCGVKFKGILNGTTTQLTFLSINDDGAGATVLSNGRFSVNGLWQFNTDGRFLALSDNVYDIGFSSSGFRPRTIFAGTLVTAPSMSVSTAYRFSSTASSDGSASAQITEPSAGVVSIDTTAAGNGLGSIICAGITLGAGSNLVVATKTPASASATGVTGTIAWDANYLYVCTATNTWKRVAIATW